MTYYARVIFDTNESTAERHEDLTSAFYWIEEELQANPAKFRLGQIRRATSDLEVVATRGAEGWSNPDVLAAAEPRRR